MPQFEIACPRCSGRGHIRVKVATTSLSSDQPTWEDQSCNYCAGTGHGQRATAHDLKRYFSEPNRAPEDLFALARTVAATSRHPRAKICTTDQVQVAYGFLGRKTRTESVTREAEADYWVLSTKKLFERELTDEEVDDHEIALCLGVDGSFRQVKRTQHSYHDQPFGWSNWEPMGITDLDHFMVEFDFKGQGRREASRFLTHTDLVSVILDRYLTSEGGYWSLTKLYPKGLGLYLALKNLVS